MEKQTIKTEKVLNAYRVLSTAKYGKMDDGGVGSLAQARGVVQVHRCKTMVRDTVLLRYSTEFPEGSSYQDVLLGLRYRFGSGGGHHYG